MQMRYSDRNTQESLTLVNATLKTDHSATEVRLIYGVTTTLPVDWRLRKSSNASGA